MNRLGPVFWQAVAYPGPYVGHGPMFPFLWASHGSSDLDMGRYVGLDDASQCLLSMRLLFEKYLRDEKFKNANGEVLSHMNVVVERFDGSDYSHGRVVARLDIRRDACAAVATLFANDAGGLSLGPVSLDSTEGAWELFIKFFAHL